MVPKSAITELPSAPIARTAGNRIGSQRIVRKPSSNFRLHKDYYLLTMATPAYKRENFEVKVIGNILRVNASQEIGPKCQFGRCEYDFSNWERSFVLPGDADPIMATARYQNGELNIILSRNNRPISQEGEYTIFVY